MAEIRTSELKDTHPLIYKRILDYQELQSGTRYDHFDIGVSFTTAKTMEGVNWWDKVIGFDGNLDFFYEKYPRENYPDGRVTDPLTDVSDNPLANISQEKSPEPEVFDESLISDGDHVKGSNDNTDEKVWTSKTLLFRGQTGKGLYITEDLDGVIATYKFIEKVIIKKSTQKALEVIQKHLPESKRSYPMSEVFKIKASVLIEMVTEAVETKI